jgi:hypothetical protein
MKMHRPRGLMAAAAIPLHVQLETKDANIGDPELKKAIDELGQTITDFRKKHDEEIAEIKKGRETSSPRPTSRRSTRRSTRRSPRSRSGPRSSRPRPTACSSGGGADGAPRPSSRRVRRADRQEGLHAEQLREYKTASRPTCAIRSEDPDPDGRLRSRRRLPGHAGHLRPHRQEGLRDHADAPAGQRGDDRHRRPRGPDRQRRGRRAWAGERPPAPRPTRRSSACGRSRSTSSTPTRR